MRRPLRRVGVVVVTGLVLTAGVAPAASASVPVPNVTGQIAAIRKLGFPSADKAQLDATLKEASQVLADIKKDPVGSLTGDSDPFAAVNSELSAYGLTTCAGDDEP